MRIKLVMLILGMCILLVTSASAYNITTFTDGSSSGNFTYTTGTESPTRTLQLSPRISVKNAILYVMGYTRELPIERYTNHQYGRNVTTYRGIWSNTGTCGTIEGTTSEINDANYSSFYGYSGGIQGGCNAEYRINFTYTYISNISKINNISVRWKTAARADIPLVINMSLYCENGQNTTIISNELTDTGGNVIIRDNMTLVPLSCVDNDTGIIKFYANFSIPTYAAVGRSFKMYDIEMNVSANQSYPTNITLKLNNDSDLFNYGASNASYLDHKILANFTSGFNYSTITLWNLSFLSNTSGILEYSGLSVSYNTAVNVTFLTEENHALFKGNMTLDVYSTGNPLVKYYTTTGYVNLEHFNHTLPLVLEYYDNKSEQPHRFYYSNPENSINVTLFVQNSTNLTNILFTLYDEIGNPLSGYYVALQRKYDVDGNYYTVEMHKTDYNGQALLNAILYTKLYKIIVYNSNLEIVYASSETEIKSTSITLTINEEEDIWYGLANAYGVSVSQIVYDNTTKQFRVSYNDVNSVLNHTTFTVVQRTAFGDVTVCSNTSTDSAKTYYCTILNPNISGYYTARLKGETRSNHSTFILGQAEYQPTNTPDKMGRAGVFMALLVFILLIAFGVYNPAVAIMLAALGLIVIVALNLIFVSIGLIVVIIILGGILLFKMRT